jgi:hypothetical protein
MLKDETNGIYHRLTEVVRSTAQVRRAMRQLLSRLVLAAALVVAQHGVYAHALSHVGKTPYGQDGSTPAKHPAAVCLAFVAAASGALPSGDLPLTADEAPAAVAAPAPADPFLPPLALTRFASRAPPLPT